MMPIFSRLLPEILPETSMRTYISSFPQLSSLSRRPFLPGRLESVIEYLLLPLLDKVAQDSNGEIPVNDLQRQC